jgi:DNA-binding NarL/FixJ family response regulator
MSQILPYGVLALLTVAYVHALYRTMIDSARQRRELRRHALLALPAERCNRCGGEFEAWHGCLGQPAVKTRPVIVVMDVSMPDLGGAEATEMIRRDCPQTRVLALTVHEADAYLRRLLDAGATRYVPKGAAAESLLRTIREVATGRISINHDSAADIVAALFNLPSERHGDQAGLTERETHVVKVFARGYTEVHATPLPTSLRGARLCEPVR